MHSPGIWLATHPVACGAALFVIGNIAPLLFLARVREPLPAFVAQLACSGAQLTLAIAAWLSVISSLEGAFHLMNCICDEPPEISIGDIDFTPEPVRPPRRWHGCT
jgi:hypothetical protein